MMMVKIGELVDMNTIKVEKDLRLFGECRGDGYVYRRNRTLDLNMFSDEERRILLEGGEVPFFSEDWVVFLDEEDEEVGGLAPDFDEDEDFSEGFDWDGEDEFE